MGICESPKKKEIPIITLNYELGNEEQKTYCTKFINYIKDDKNINYVINSTNHFSIYLSYYNISHLIKDDHDFSDQSMSVSLTKIHNIMKQTCDGTFFPQHNKNDDNNNYKNNEIKKLNEVKENLLKKQIEKRANPTPLKMENNEKINQELEDMVIYGNIMKKQIKEEKLKNPGKFIEIKDALKSEEKDKGLFALGLLADCLQQNGTDVVIQNTTDEEEIDAGTTCLQFITNGLGQKTAYGLHFDFGHQRNEELLNNKNEFEKFKEKLKEKLSKDYNIPKNKIIVTFPQKGSVLVQVIFQSDEFNNLNINEFLSKFKNDSNYPELNKLKTIHTDIVLGGCKLSLSQLDSRGNRVDGWGINEKRGNKPYDPPLGWIGIGLRVMDKYDNGDNKWIGMNNSVGEWCVAYHGVGRRLKPNEVQNITKLIYQGGFKPGENQVYKNDDDQFHPGKKVGTGVYCTPKISEAELYAGESTIKNSNTSYKTVLMVRVRPDAIRCSKDKSDYWVVNGTTDEIRPYRILYKKIN